MRVSLPYCARTAAASPDAATRASSFASVLNAAALTYVAAAATSMMQLLWFAFQIIGASQRNND